MCSVRRVALVAVLTLIAMAAFVRLAVAAGGDVRRIPALIPSLAPVTHPATPPPLLLATPSPAKRTTASASRGIPSVGHFDPTLKRPFIPSYQEALRHVTGKRRLRSADGGGIILLGSQAIPLTTGITYYFDGTLQYGDSNEKLECYGLTAGASYNYVIFAPNTTPYVSGAVTTDGAGTCSTAGSMYSVPAFSTPFNGTSVSGAPNPAYPGVWAVAMKDTSGNYVSITYIVVVGAQSLVISKDAAGTQQSNDFSAGSTLYVNASGLSPDQYALGFSYDGGPVQCVYTLPNGPAVPYNGPCFNNGQVIPGITPTGGSITAGWPTGAAKAGAYSITLEDVTTKTVVAHTQISISPSTQTWTLTPYKGATAGTNANDTFAFDGYADQSVSGVDFKVAGLPALGTDQLMLTLSDANGAPLNALSQLESGAATSSTKAAAGTVDFGTITFPLKTTRTSNSGPPFNIPLSLYQGNDLFGPTVATFRPPVMTAQVYDKTTKTVVAAKTFTLLAYRGKFAWPSATGTTLTTTVAGAPSTITLSNPGRAVYGPNSYDNLKGFTIAADANGETLSYTGPATVPDSKGNNWNVSFSTAVVAAGQITITPVLSTTVLDAAATLPISVKVASPSASCGSGCALATTVLPQHGITSSAVNVASNSLPVTSGSGAAAGSATFGWQVTSQPAPLPAAIRSLQGMYVAGTSGSASGATYQLTLTVSNTSPAGNSNNISDLEITLPPTFNAGNVSLTSFTSSGCTSPCNWSATAASAIDSSAPPNAINLWDQSTIGSNNPPNTIVPGATATIVLSFPMWATSAIYTDTTIHANINGGCPLAAQPYCPTVFNQYDLSKTAATRAAIVPSSTVIDSTALGVYSLSPTLMSSAFVPSVIAAGAATTAKWQITNTATSQDANPDYIDSITLATPTGMVPDSISGLPAGWGAYKVGSNWVLTLCGSAACTPTSAQWQNSLAPGATLSATFNYTTTFPVTGVYSMPWTVSGANGGASASGSTPVTVNSTAATIGFTYAGGLGGNAPNGTTAALTAVAGEPTVGSDADTTYGNTFVYEITNTGNTSISGVSIAVPYQDRYFVNAPASTGTNVFAISSVLVAGSGSGGAGCTGTLGVLGSPAATTAGYFSSTTSAAGVINLTGCTGFAVGKKIDVFIDMKAPYAIGSEFPFTAKLNPTTTPIAATPTYAASNFLKIILDARLTIMVPTGGGAVPTPGGPGATATTSCTGTACSWNGTPGTPPSVPIVDFGTLAAGTFTFSNLINASVITDGSGSDGWQLYVSSDNNPVASGITLNTETGSSTTGQAGFTTNLSTSAYSSVPYVPGASPNPASALLMSTFAAAPSIRRAPIDNLSNFQLSFPSTVPSGLKTVTVTYTLVVN